MIAYLCILIYVVYLCERIVDIGQTVCYAIFITLFCIYTVSHINITCHPESKDNMPAAHVYK